jgi:hypothetical protein
LRIEGPNLVLRTKRSKELNVHSNRAKLFTWLEIWVLILGIIIYGVSRGIALDVRIEPIQNSPGFHYQHEAQARLYSSKWRVVTYLHLKQACDNIDDVSKYAEQTIEFCRKHDNTLWLNLTECRTIVSNANRKLTNLKEMRSLVSQLTRTEKVDHRRKSGRLTS